MNNYEKQAASAKLRFLSYDAQDLAEKCGLALDENYLYAQFLQQDYRICRKDGNLEKRLEQCWTDANSFEEVMTLLDLICDSKENRFLTGQWKTMENFGHGFHRGLLEARDPRADDFSQAPEKLEAACRRLRAEKIPGADIGYAIELFDGLRIGLQFWQGDEEFFPRLRFLWDENADQYLRYETMFYAVGLLVKRLEELIAAI